MVGRGCISLKNRGSHLGLRERFLRPGIGLGVAVVPLETGHGPHVVNTEEPTPG